MSKLSITSLFLLSFLLGGCGEEEIPPAKMTSGKDLYNYYCKNCHEQRGPGASMEKASDKEPMKPYKIVLMIKYGYEKDKHGMSVFDQLSEKQADAVARYAVELQRAHQAQ